MTDTQATTLIITKADVRDVKYVGEALVSDFRGNVEIEASLGYVAFASLKLSGYIYAKAG